MASNELERATNNMESGVRQILNGLKQVRDTIEYYNQHDLETELAGITIDELIVSTGNGITKRRLADLAVFADSALYRIYEDGDGSGNTLLGRTADDPATMKDYQEKLAI